MEVWIDYLGHELGSADSAIPGPMFDGENEACSMSAK
jgi:hypothetical protein